jgi:hypothetical protein
MRHLTKITPFLLLSLFFSTPILINAKNVDQLQAVFIERFTRFITWPQPIKSFNICVMKQDNIFHTLKEIYSIHPIKKSHCTFKKLLKPDEKELDSCHLLYIGKIDVSTKKTLLSKLQNRPILTISAQPNYAKEGVMINFLLHDKHVHFEVNQKSLNSSHIKMSALLLNNAQKRY